MLNKHVQNVLAIIYWNYDYVERYKWFYLWNKTFYELIFEWILPVQMCACTSPSRWMLIAYNETKTITYSSKY